MLNETHRLVLALEAIRSLVTSFSTLSIEHSDICGHRFAKVTLVPQMFQDSLDRLHLNVLLVLLERLLAN